MISSYLSLSHENFLQFKKDSNLQLTEIISIRLSIRLKRQTIKLSKENFFSLFYIPKVICISSKIPFLEEKSIKLNLLLRYTLDNNEVKIPIKKIFENIMLEISFPPKGFITFNFNLVNTQILIKKYTINKIQIFGY